MIDSDFLIHDRHSYIVHGEDDYDWLVIVLGSVSALFVLSPLIIIYLLAMFFYKLYKLIETLCRKESALS